ncbi:hypothetical protein AURDEDRAFT_169129 [Auricularia subglabra TFB-10046 SS5]|nr:hypothetical protein AURDEDRAFT_169129 [Auricularia subglabra TFB-10046 SS5]
MALRKAVALAWFLGALTVLQLGLVLFITRPYRRERGYSYVGDDVPNMFATPETEPVALFIENPQAHYRLSLADGENWGRLAPNDARIYLGPDEFKRPFTLGLFHQLNCLDVVRLAVLSVDPQTGVYNSSSIRETRNCMNYLRQMVLCQADTRLERVSSWTIPPYSQMEQDQVCRDWRVVYEAASQNDLEYKARRRDQ